MLNPMPRQPSMLLPLILAASAMPGMPWGGPTRRTVETPDRGTCGLPSCSKPANRGGYCSAEHCREARELDRKARGFTR